MSYTLNGNEIFLIVWCLLGLPIIAYWLGRFHEWKINKKREDLLTFEFEDKDDKE